MTGKKILIIIICIVTVIVLGVVVKKASKSKKYDDYLKIIRANEAQEEKDKQEREELAKKNEELQEQALESMEEKNEKETVYKDASGIEYKMVLNDNDEIIIEPYFSDVAEEKPNLSVEMPKLDNDNIEESFKEKLKQAPEEDNIQLSTVEATE